MSQPQEGRVAASAVGSSQTELTYARPRPSDRQRVAAVVRETRVFRPEEVDVALEVFDDYCESPGVDYHAIAVYGESGILAGFGFYGPTPCTVDTWDLYWIAVGPSFQRRGAGRGLLERAERDMRALGARACVIETSSRDDYTATREFYLSCGYDEVARVRDFYDEGEDRVTYIKRLTEID